MLDIIFENRNKAYGAYELRKNYGKVFSRAFFIFLLVLSAIISLVSFKTEVKPMEKPIEVNVSLTREIKLPTKAKEKRIAPRILPKTTTPVKVKSARFVPPVVLKNEEVEPDKAVQNDLKTLIESSAAIGAQSTEGETMDVPSVEGLDLDGTGIIEAPKKEPVPKDDILIFVEKSASFPGGEAEMMKFLKANIVYPSVARENGITGRVVLQFVVEKDGSISNVKVIRTLGGGTDEEAMRVVKEMPKWIPANQNGNVVRQRYTLPVYFRIAG